ncbi:MAG: phosphatidate cytidylyltransferase [Thermoanaerobacteraceae bacterium]
MLKTRIISAVVGLPLLFFVIIKGSMFLEFALILLSIFALNEFYNCCKNLDTHPVKIIGYISAILIYIFNNYITDFELISLLIIIIMPIMLFNKKYNIKDVSMTLIGILYIPVFFLYIMKIREMNHGIYLVWFVFIVSWFTDTFAYFTGVYFGKTKLIPSISPHKTIEGSIGGLLGSIIGSIIFLLIFPDIKLSIYLTVILSLTGSIVAQTGDLVASAIKRNCHLKDYGNIIPGHGGILDRFDSIIFVSPFIYFFLNIFIK